jgi:hypothetical protein
MTTAGNVGGIDLFEGDHIAFPTVTLRRGA